MSSWTGSPGSRTGWASSGGTFDIENRRTKLTVLEARMAEQGFWDRPEKARETIQEVKQLKGWVEAGRVARSRPTGGR